MDSERWDRINEIVADALEAPSLSARQSLVAERCGKDAELRREVETLLNQTTTTLENYAVSATESLQRETMTLTPGRRVGAYVIERELGRGGMGAVYLARRADGTFNKQVAIKVLKRGTDTDEVLIRFQSEREILARLVHPNIARLLDAGSTQDGLPYFVMDYLEGKTITSYADGEQLSLAARLELFREVCAAVSYAHQNLIVHRDLKPSNVLVTNDGEVHLLDFGIAKLIHPSEPPEATLTVAPVMTPEYASPEQLKSEPITTGSDVYSLGVLLYELLTGERPFRLSRKTSDELSRAICEQEPLKPSTTVAKGRGSSNVPFPSSKMLRGDLDNIILKALRKYPARRYASVEQFSEDIRRHLEGLPVKARRDTITYRTAKFITRHKVAVAAATIVALALIAASITTAWQAHEARREKQLADERFTEVRKLAHSVLFDYHDQIAALPGSTKVRKQLVSDSLTYLDSLRKQAGDDTALQREIAAAYVKIGDVQGRPYVANLGDAKGALESYAKSLALMQELSVRQPANPEIQEALALSYGRLGLLSVATGNPTAATANLKKAAVIYDGLRRREPDNKAVRAEVGWIDLWIGVASGFSSVSSLGDAKVAMEYYEMALAILEPLVAQNPTNVTYRQYLAAVYPFIADLLMSRGQQGEALDSFRKALVLHEALARENPTNTYLQRELAVNYSNICNLMRHMDKNEGALENGRKALAIFEKLAAADPDDANIAEDLAVMHQNLAFSLNKANDAEGALDHFRRALQKLKELAVKNPTNVELLMREEWAYLKISEALLVIDSTAEATQDAREAISILESFDAAHAKNAAETHHLALAYAQLAKCYARQALTPGTQEKERVPDLREAREWAAKSRDLWRDMRQRQMINQSDEKTVAEVDNQIAEYDSELNQRLAH